MQHCWSATRLLAGPRTVRQHRQVAHCRPAMWAIPGRVQLCKTGQDAALLLCWQGCADHDGAAAGSAGEHVTHTACSRSNWQQNRHGRRHSTVTALVVSMYCARHTAPQTAGDQTLVHDGPRMQLKFGVIHHPVVPQHRPCGLHVMQVDSAGAVHQAAHSCRQPQKPKAQAPSSIQRHTRTYARVRFNSPLWPQVLWPSLPCHHQVQQLRSRNTYQQ
jgi:hypothetical protein